MFSCATCSVSCKDNYDLNKHFATGNHLKKCIENNLEIVPIDITKLGVEEEEEYIRNHPYFKDQYRSADNYRKKLNEQENELRAQLGFVFDKNKGWVSIKEGECLSYQEIEELVEEKYPYDESESNCEARFEYRKILEGSRHLSIFEKEEIRNKIDSILEKQHRNYKQHLNSKMLDIYKKQARSRLIQEYNQLKIQQSKNADKEAKEAQKKAEQQAKEAQKKAEKETIKKQKLEAKMAYLKALE
jgi:hypothetical protein